MKKDQKDNNKLFKHGSKFNCPTCGMSGTADLTDERVNFIDSIWISQARKQWICTNCFFKERSYNGGRS